MTEVNKQYTVENQEINDDELVTVAGGGANLMIPCHHNYYERCPFCGKVINMVLRYHESECPKWQDS